MSRPITVRIFSADLQADPETTVAFDAGLDHLEQFVPGTRFNLSVEVVSRHRDAFGEQMAVRPVSLGVDDD